MKKYILIVFSLFTLNGFAQQFTETDIFDYANNVEWGSNGYYYKDVNNYLNQFVGNWRFTLNSNGSQYKVYELRFAKKTFTETTPNGSTYKIDALVGEMRIVKQGVEIYNNLNNFNQNFTSDTQYNIYNFNRTQNINCNNCTVPYQRLTMGYKEPGNDNMKFYDLSFLIHTYQQNGKTYLRVDFPQSRIRFDSFNMYDENSPPTKTELFFNFGTYDFVRVY